MAIVLGLIGGLKLMGIGVLILGDEFELRENALPYVAFLVIFVIIVFLVSVSGRMLKALIDITLLGAFDQAVGSVFGLLKSGLVISVFLWIFNQFHWNDWWKEKSVLFPWLEPIAPTLGRWLAEIFPFLSNYFE